MSSLSQLSSRRTALSLAAGLAGVAVVLGALAAHQLESVLSDAEIKTFQTAVRYHMWHAIAIFVAAATVESNRSFGAVATLFSVGIVLFSGSLYALALGAPSWIGMITPLGGLSFIAAWAVLAVGYLKSRGA